MVSCRCKTSVVQDDRHSPEQRKTSRKLINWSWRTIAEQLTNLLIWLRCPGAPVCSEFWLRNWEEKSCSEIGAWRIITSSHDECVPRIKGRALEGELDLSSKVITGDASWCWGYDPEKKHQSSQWKHPSSPQPNEARQVKSNVKTMLIYVFDVRGTVHKELVTPDQAVNQTFYLVVPKRLRDAGDGSAPTCGKAERGGFITAMCQRATSSVRQRLATRGHHPGIITNWPAHVSLLAHLAPWNVFLLLFPRMQKVLKGKRFADVVELKKYTTEVFYGISLQEFQNCYIQWKTRLDRCTASREQYSKGDASVNI